MAGALGVRLAGPRCYGGVPVEDSYIGQGQSYGTPGDLRRALSLYRRACAIEMAGIAALLIIAWLM